jgi:hypothetical protein
VVDPERWSRLLADVQSERASQPLRICELCVQALDMSGAGISLVTDDGNRGVVCSTDDVAARIEELQFGLGEGPCVDAVTSGSPVLVGDLLAPAGVAVNRWPAFMDSADGAGIRAVFAFPLQIGAIKVGALDLYRDRPGDLGPDELTSALLAADAAAIAVLSLDTATQELFADDEGRRSSYRMQVHQATGMVMVQAGVHIQQALLLLRARAFSSGRSLSEVATDVVERRLRFSTEDS